MHVLIGLDYDTFGIADEEIGKGHCTIERRNVTLKEVISELVEFLTIGSQYPQFSPAVNPEVAYAYDLNLEEDADILGVVENLLNKSLERSKNRSNH